MVRGPLAGRYSAVAAMVMFALIGRGRPRTCFGAHRAPTMILNGDSGQRLPPLQPRFRI